MYVFVLRDYSPCNEIPRCKHWSYLMWKKSRSWHRILCFTVHMQLRNNLYQFEINSRCTVQVRFSIFMHCVNMCIVNVQCLCAVCTSSLHAWIWNLLLLFSVCANTFFSIKTRFLCPKFYLFWCDSCRTVVKNTNSGHFLSKLKSISGFSDPDPR